MIYGFIEFTTRRTNFELIDTGLHVYLDAMLEPTCEPFTISCI